MRLRLTEILAAAAGAMIFDLLFCGVVAPKIIKALDLRAAKKQHCCGGCQAGNSCETHANHAQPFEPDVFRPVALIGSGESERVM